jgi:DNA-binding NtrC family response regulator
MLLAHRFLARYSNELGKQVVGFTKEAEARIAAYTFPGNVRELQNLVERGVVLCRGQVITEDELPAPLLEATPSRAVNAPPHAQPEPWVPMTLEEAMRDPERRVLLRALNANAWNRQKTAEQLGVNRTTLYKKLKALGIESGDTERAA